MSRDQNFMIPLPRDVGTVNWWGAWELYLKEIRRFSKVATQTVVAPMVTTVLFLIIFTFAFDRPPIAGVPFNDFLVPGLVMMSIVQNSFANTSSSILISKVQGNIIDVLMPPLSAMEISIAWTLGAVTRGLTVGIAALLAMWFFAEIHVFSIFHIVYHAVTGAIFMSCAGIIAAIWADKFDHMSAITNFVVTPLTFLSGTFYTIDRLPEGLRFICNYNPFFYAIDGFRYGFLGHDSANSFIGVIVTGLTASISLLITYLMLKSGYKLKS
ncbi:MAG: multidrug ABC transporter permease [Rhodospirillaceae bacterium]|nr:multidrug ABC transporter permease [Rhodospirillaceae bacterium]